MALVRIYISIFICLLVACEAPAKKFDPLAWAKESDGFYEYREAMLDDLLKNHLHKGMKYAEVIRLLGQPQMSMGSPQYEIGYTVMVYYGFDIDPVESKDLYIRFSQDSSIVGYELKEWKKGQ